MNEEQGSAANEKTEEISESTIVNDHMTFDPETKDIPGSEDNENEAKEIVNIEEEVTNIPVDNPESEILDYDKNTDENTKEVLDDIENLLNDDEFIESLNVVDTWDGDEESNKKKSEPIHDKKQKDNKHGKDDKKNSKDDKIRNKYRSNSKDKARKDDKKYEMSRRDPSKSSKDIEKDKLRTKKDAESKILAEKEKALKKILDSDTVVPPGTESEAIEKIVEKQGTEEDVPQRRSRERRRSNDRYRPSPNRIKRSPYRSRRRSPSLDRPNFRHRSPLSPERIRRSSPRSYRRRSIDKYSPDRRSIERKRRHELRDRELKFRRSRSIDRRRSRSIERRRRYSRTPDRRDDRWRRTRSRSKSPSRRSRKRSPFINEIARQFSKDGLLVKTPQNSSPQFLNTPPVAPAPPTITPMVLGPNQQFASSLPMPPMVNSGTPYMNYEPSNPTSIYNNDTVSQMPLQPVEFSSGPLIYNNPGRIVSGMGPMPGSIPSPQPVPPPSQTMYNHIRGIPGPSRSPVSTSGTLPQPDSAADYGSEYLQPMPFIDLTQREERLKTPEPPVISDAKLFEKTSLSSLLEASVSAKESSGPPVLYPGFKPDILKNCERALQDLPVEDPRLKMKGRFFFDPVRKEPCKAQAPLSNSILLRKGANKISWDDEDRFPVKSKNQVMTHQKICQTDEIEIESKGIQVSVEMISIGVQVYPTDLTPTKVDEKRPVQERLDWSKCMPGRREPDLRESINNSRERMELWKPLSPSRMQMEPRNFNVMMSPVTHTMDFAHRDTIVYRPVDGVREQQEYIPPLEESFRQPVPAQYDRPLYQHSGFSAPMGEFEERRMTENIAMMREQDEEEMDIERSNWNARGNALGGKLGSLYKLRARGRSLRGRGTPYSSGNF